MFCNSSHKALTGLKIGIHWHMNSDRPDFSSGALIFFWLLLSLPTGNLVFLSNLELRETFEELPVFNFSLVMTKFFLI